MMIIIQDNSRFQDMLVNIKTNMNKVFRQVHPVGHLGKPFAATATAAE